MPHTKSRYQQDLGFTDGRIFLGPGDFNVSGTAAVIRNAVVDWSINQAASLTVLYAANLTMAVMYRTGFGEDLQEQFGGAGIAGSAEYQGRPDTLGAMSTGQPITPRTAFKVKGIKLLSFNVLYKIVTTGLTTHTVRVDQVTYTDLSAPTTVVLAVGTNGLILTASGGTPRVTNVVIPVAQQIYRIVTNTQIWIELNVVTPAASTYQLYGVDCACEFNYN